MEISSLREVLLLRFTQRVYIFSLKSHYSEVNHSFPSLGDLDLDTYPIRKLVVQLRNDESKDEHCRIHHRRKHESIQSMLKNDLFVVETETVTNG